MIDSGRDGIKSPGRYNVYIDGVKTFGSRRTAWKKRVHRFTITAPSPSPTPMPPSQPHTTPVQCSPASQTKVKLELLTDKFGGDTSWEVDDQGKTLIKSDKVYGSGESDVKTFCLDKGRSYNFIFRDKVGGGFQSDGYFKVSLFDDNSWREVVSVSKFRSKELEYKINLKEVAMTVRDQEWLVSLLFVLYQDITVLNIYSIHISLSLFM
jgi:hypothetical protein